MAGISFLQRKKLVIATAAYWLLLVYILAALIFWFIELQKQTQQMAALKQQELRINDSDYQHKLEEISQEQKRKNTQYIGEGSIFLLVIVIGAVYLYRAVIHQIRIQQQQQNFMMAITHELKTPLAVAKLNLETLLRHRLEEEKQKKLLHSALEETNRLNDITNNILVSAQLEGGAYVLAHDEIDLSSLLLKCINDFRGRFPERKFELNIQPDLTIWGDIPLLQILFNNLIENAIKYSPREAPIQVRLDKTNSLTIFSIHDQGTGIPDIQKHKVFKKFYRLGNEATRTAQGTGLGLYLCKKIAADHEATISIGNNTPVGTIFAVAFPEMD
jgi:two-component system, OmpR family, sensor histidine kinase CiaH